MVSDSRTYQSHFRPKRFSNGSSRSFRRAEYVSNRADLQSRASMIGLALARLRILDALVTMRAVKARLHGAALDFDRLADAANSAA
jgi:hypothetical protein